MMPESRREWHNVFFDICDDETKRYSYRLRIHEIRIRIVQISNPHANASIQLFIIESCMYFSFLSKSSRRSTNCLQFKFNYIEGINLHSKHKHWNIDTNGHWKSQLKNAVAWAKIDFDSCVGLSLCVCVYAYLRALANVKLVWHSMKTNMAFVWWKFIIEWNFHSNFFCLFSLGKHKERVLNGSTVDKSCNN